jgi:predicted metal-dependent enzyme (double-stranded beta helix superfamily)
VTPIHDHVTWCVFGVIQGVEHDELFELDEERVSRIGSSVRRYYDLPVLPAG